jgi:hypothetical protein
MKIYLKMFVFVMLVLTAIDMWGAARGQLLEAKKPRAKLPSPLRSASAVFDGEDSVYIFGGYKFL